MPVFDSDVFQELCEYYLELPNRAGQLVRDFVDGTTFRSLGALGFYHGLLNKYLCGGNSLTLRGDSMEYRIWAKAGRLLERKWREIWGDELPSMLPGEHIIGEIGPRARLFLTVVVVDILGKQEFTEHDLLATCKREAEKYLLPIQGERLLRLCNRLLDSLCRADIVRRKQ